jgi:hypothetical protein
MIEQFGKGNINQEKHFIKLYDGNDTWFVRLEDIASFKIIKKHPTSEEEFKTKKCLVKFYDKATYTWIIVSMECFEKELQNYVINAE